MRILNQVAVFCGANTVRVTVIIVTIVTVITVIVTVIVIIDSWSGDLLVSG